MKIFAAKFSLKRLDLIRIIFDLKVRFKKEVKLKKKRKSAFWQGVDKLIELSQQALNKWVFEYFKFNFDPYFSHGLHDDYPASAITEIFKASQKLKAKKFDKRLRLAVCNLLEDILTFEPALKYEVLLAITKNKITEAVDKIIKLINSGRLIRYTYQRKDFHFLFLEFLPELYQSKPSSTQEKNVNKKIETVLRDNTWIRKYTTVCRKGLSKIEKL